MQLMVRIWPFLVDSMCWLEVDMRHFLIWLLFVVSVPAFAVTNEYACRPSGGGTPAFCNVDEGDIDSTAAAGAGYAPLSNGSNTTTWTDITTAAELSTWTGSINITTLGTIGTGTWQGTAIGDTYLSDALTISGGTISNSTFTFATSTTPSQTTEGQCSWDSDDDQIACGDGSTTRKFSDDSNFGTLGAVEGDIIPDADGTRDLGSATTRWAEVHTDLLEGIGTLTAVGDLDIGSFEFRAQTFQSDVTTGTAPLTVASTTVVTNLNADLLDGESASAFQDADADLTTWAGITPGTGIDTFLATPSSANLRGALTDESGTGVALFAGGDIGAATATTPAAEDNDTSVATTAYVQTELGNATEVRSMYWGAGAMSSDGTQCADPAEVTINSGPKQYTVICTDNDASTVYGSTVMPDGWDAGTVTFELAYVQTAADTNALNGDVTAQCRGAGETVNNTWGTEVAIDDAAVTGSNAVDNTTSAAVTPNGTCAAGDTLFWRWQMDATGTTTAAATLNLLGMKMEYTSNVGD